MKYIEKNNLSDNFKIANPPLSEKGVKIGQRRDIWSKRSQ